MLGPNTRANRALATFIQLDQVVIATIAAYCMHYFWLTRKRGILMWPSPAQQFNSNKFDSHFHCHLNLNTHDYKLRNYMHKYCLWSSHWRPMTRSIQSKSYKWLLLNSNWIHATLDWKQITFDLWQIILNFLFYDHFIKVIDECILARQSKWAFCFFNDTYKVNLNAFEYIYKYPIWWLNCK